MIMDKQILAGKEERKMKNRFFILGIASLLMAGCTKELTELKLVLPRANEDVKVVLHNGYSPRWSSGDEVLVNGTTCVVNGSTTTAPTASSYTALFPADAISGVSSIEGRESFYITIPQNQPYTEEDGKQVFRAPMVAYTTGNTLNFQNICSVMKVEVHNNSGEVLIIDKIELHASNNGLSGTGWVTNIRSTPKLVSSSGDYIETATPAHFVSLTDINARIEIGGYSQGYYIYMLPTNDEDNKMTVTVYAHSALSGRMYSFSREQSRRGIDMTAGVIASATITAENSNRSYLPCFSVSADKKVVFSTRGNVYEWYSDGSKNRFWDYQYYSLGNSNDLSGDENHDFFKGYRRSFGMSNTEYHGVIYGREWRMLTADEWDYLLNSRGDYFKAPACINTGSTTYNGLLILPDGWVRPDGVSYYSTATTYSGNTYTSSQWNTMQSSGAIFLPAAGSANSSDEISGWNSVGHYWSSTTGDSPSTHKSLQFFSSGSFTINLPSTSSSEQMTVRLVRDL